MIGMELRPQQKRMGRTMESRVRGVLLCDEVATANVQSKT
jgi:hypothetical protein